MKLQSSSVFFVAYWHIMICVNIVFVLFVISMAQPVPEHIDFSKEEEKILQLWKELNAFHTSLSQSKNRPRSEVMKRSLCDK